MPTVDVDPLVEGVAFPENLNGIVRPLYATYAVGIGGRGATNLDTKDDAFFAIYSKRTLSGQSLT